MIEKYILSDIVECYEITDSDLKNFVEHQYVIVNVFNRDVRTVKEDTFVKLTNHGLTITEKVGV